MFDAEYFGDPLTTEKFDRTLRQRHERASVVAALYRTGANDVETKANQILFERFLEQVEGAIGLRTNELTDAISGSEDPSLSDSLRQVATHDVMIELKILDDALPLHGLERIAAQQGARS